uniref:Uncharacterized protein n=1 Tax=Acrobeloides nanus TaxID=290746 RepID=A0A914BXC3_9BILA
MNYGPSRNVDEDVFEFIELFTFVGEYIRRHVLGLRFIGERVLVINIKAKELYDIFLNHTTMMKQIHKEVGIECKSLKNCVAKFFLHEDDFHGYNALERHLKMKQLIENAKKNVVGFTTTKLQGKFVYKHIPSQYTAVTIFKSEKKKNGEFVTIEKPVSYHKRYRKMPD